MSQTGDRGNGFKIDASPFLALLGERKNVHFVQDRVIANWMGFSLVEATLRLLRDAVVQGFDYCVLLSGADYPIKSSQYLFDFFGKAEKEFIAFWRLADRPSWMHKVQYYYAVDTIPIRDYSNNREPVYWRRLFWGRFFRYRKYMPKRKFLNGLVPFGGPDWWSLSHGCASFILKYVADNPRYKRFYKFSSSPGEMFFQTIILNSEWAERVENRNNYLAWSSSRLPNEPGLEKDMLPDEAFNFRYVDWSGELSGAREKPAVLDERDWEAISSSTSHFARKFDDVRSAALLERIDREILGIVQ